jgi:hypothetical protein
LQWAAITGKTPRAANRRNKRKPLRPVATGCVRSSMVRRGSTVRVRQRASIKYLQIGTLLLSVRRTCGHISDTSAVRATHRDVSRRLLTRLAGTDATGSAGKSLLIGRSRCLSRRDRDPLRAREGVEGSRNRRGRPNAAWVRGRARVTSRGGAQGPRKCRRVRSPAPSGWIDARSAGVSRPPVVAASRQRGDPPAMRILQSKQVRAYAAASVIAVMISGVLCQCSRLTGIP